MWCWSTQTQPAAASSRRSSPPARQQQTPQHQMQQAPMRQAVSRQGLRAWMQQMPLPLSLLGLVVVVEMCPVGWC